MNNVITSGPVLPFSTTEENWFPVRITAVLGPASYTFQEVWLTDAGLSIADRIGGNSNTSNDPAIPIDGGTFSVTAAGTAVQVLARRAPGLGGVGWELKGFGTSLAWRFKSEVVLIGSRTMTLADAITYDGSENLVLGWGGYLQTTGAGYAGWVYVNSSNVPVSTYMYYPIRLAASQTWPYFFQVGFKANQAPQEPLPAGTAKLALMIIDATYVLGSRGFYSGLTVPVEYII